MTKEESKKRVTELVIYILECKETIKTKKSRFMNTEYEERDMWKMQSEVNKLSGLEIYK